MDCQMGHTRQDDSIIGGGPLSPEKESLKYAEFSKRARYIAEEMRRLLPDLSPGYAVAHFANMSPGQTINTTFWELLEMYAEVMEHRESYDPKTSDNMERLLDPHHAEYAKVHQSKA